MDADRILVVVLAGVTFASFVWAVRGYFVREGELQPGMRMIATGGLVTMVAQAFAFLWAPAMPRVLGAAGGTLYALALVVFWGAVHAHRRRPPAIAFSECEPRQLVTGGIYGVVRHPFYLAYTLAWVGGACATGQPWLLASVFGMGALYVEAARQEEATFAEGHFQAPWAEYRARTAMFLPLPMPRLALAAREPADPQRYPTP